MNQKGFTLLEVVGVIIIASIIGGAVTPCIGVIENIKLNTLVSEVQIGLKNAQQRAHFTNTTYEIAHDKTENRIKISKKGTSPIQENYDIPHNTQVFIGNKEMVGEEFKLKFEGDMSPSQAGTITFMNHKLKKKIQMTIRPVTGKVTVYEDRLD